MYYQKSPKHLPFQKNLTNHPNYLYNDYSLIQPSVAGVADAIVENIPTASKATDNKG